MKKLENNWRQKSLENLEKDFWGNPPIGATPLIEKVYRWRTIPTGELEPKHLRLLIGQQVGLFYLIPLALEILKRELLIDSELYEGDLLRSVLTVEDAFWLENIQLKNQLDALLKPYSEEDQNLMRKGKFIP